VVLFRRGSIAPAARGYRTKCFKGVWGLVYSFLEVMYEKVSRGV